MLEWRGTFDEMLQSCREKQESLSNLLEHWKDERYENYDYCQSSLRQPYFSMDIISYTIWKPYFAFIFAAVSLVEMLRVPLNR